MSYPRTIQTLIIEDDQQPKEYYTAVVDANRDKHRIASPHFAFCYDDGLRHLCEDRIYHLVTIDLRLPEHPSLPPAESLEFGLALLEECRKRNTYPIPAVLVISAHLDQAHQEELDRIVRNSFAYGRVHMKSDRLEEEFAQALRFIDSYNDIGIHVQDGGRQVFPTLTPREEDLLRRAVLANHAAGLDVAWWSCECDADGFWTKTLIGRFILQDGLGLSLFTFFKLSTETGAQTVFQEAQMMSQKLRHVKVLGTFIAGDRSLLITQSVGTGTAAPLSLGTMLSRPVVDIANYLDRVAEDIVSQVALLGDRTPDQKEVCQLLWQQHNPARIEAQWEIRGGPDVLRTYGSSVSSPVELFRQLRADRTLQRYEHQSALHGDLNVRNVAVDRDPAGFHAFIFDASGSKAGVCVWDIAMLEVTTLLHQDDDESLVESCAALYGNDFEECTLPAAESDRRRNTMAFIQSIRRRAFERTPKGLYALMVVDHALLQLGGLAFGSAFNKIGTPRAACLLAALATNWYRIARGSAS